MTAKPLVKWAGGKRWLAKRLAPRIQARLDSTGGRYIEPFLGGGAVALHLGAPNDMILGDVCAPLIDMYRAVQRNPGAVYWSLKTLIDRGTDRETYLDTREHPTPSLAVAAARFIYLNRLGFNGLHRENRAGRNNVPYGGGSSRAPKFPTQDEIKAVSVALADSTLACQSAIVTIEQAKAGDVIYADPPYDGMFTQYSAGGFTDEDQEALARALHAAHERGAHVVASNNDTERIQRLYAWAWIDSIVEHHKISRKADTRGPRTAVLIASDEGLLD